MASLLFLQLILCSSYRNCSCSWQLDVSPLRIALADLAAPNPFSLHLLSHILDIPTVCIKECSCHVNSLRSALVQIEFFFHGLPLHPRPTWLSPNSICLLVLISLLKVNYLGDPCSLFYILKAEHRLNRNLLNEWVVASIIGVGQWRTRFSFRALAMICLTPRCSWYEEYWKLLCSHWF